MHPTSSAGPAPSARGLHRFIFAALLTAGFLAAAPVGAGVQTFGLDGGGAALAARPQAEWVRQAQTLEKRADWIGLLSHGRDWARADRQNPIAWFVQGRALAELGRHAEAIAAYRQNLRLVPRDVWAWNNLGSAWRDSGNPREAMQAYRAAVEIDPGYLPAWSNLGLTFYLAKGEAGVAQALQRLEAADPKLAAAWRQLAIEHSMTRDPRLAGEAIEIFRGIDEARRRRLFDIVFADV